MPEQNKELTEVAIQMYKLGTGDCFVLIFRYADGSEFKMMIDCGCWTTQKFARIRTIVERLKEEVAGHIDVLVVTHEHLDHIRGFEAARKIFTEADPSTGMKFQFDRVWMGWTEEDGDPEVSEWKKEYGQKKLALAKATGLLRQKIARKDFKEQFSELKFGSRLLKMRENFSEGLQAFSDLHVGENFNAKEYAGMMKGMSVVKNDIVENNIEYFKPGQLIETIPGVRIYVLGPPTDYLHVADEHGKEGEAYRHNNELGESDLFAKAFEDASSEIKSPFDPAYHSNRAPSGYRLKEHKWRRIDYDWLFSSGQFALRMNSLTNNLSLALAIEIKSSGQVLLFPGDAEIGSWKSWQNLSWEVDGGKVTVNDLLKRTAFYKVAHHLSHNGTAKSIGLEKMSDPGLVAMATLDYGIISNRWKSTMPNQRILRDLLHKTKGRLLVMNETDLVFKSQHKEVPLKTQIKNERLSMTEDARNEFKERVRDTPELIEYLLGVPRTSGGSQES